MANLNELFGVDGGALKTMGAAIGLLADIGGAIGTVELVLGAFGILQSSDADVSAALAQINTELQALEGQVAAGQLIAHNDAIYTQLNDSRTVFTDLAELATAQAGLPVAQQAAFGETQVETCINGVGYFLPPSEAWRFVPASTPYYSVDLDGLIPQLGLGGDLRPTPAGDGTVFTYVYTAPAFLQAITYFLATVLTLRPGTLPARSVLLRQCIDVLHTVYETVVAGNPPDDPSPGIVGWPIGDPEYPDGGSAATTVYPQFPRLSPIDPPGNIWTSGGQPYGGVEQYSGGNQIDSYPAFIGPPPSWPSGAGTPPIEQATSAEVTKLSLRVLQRQKVVFERSGMPALRTTINNLRILVGEPPLITPPYYEDWSMHREVLGALHPYINVFGGSIVRRIGAFLDTTAPTPPEGSEYVGHGHLSLRQMLTGAHGW